jgi:hypothetical protein
MTYKEKHCTPLKHGYIMLLIIFTPQYTTCQHKFFLLVSSQSSFVSQQIHHMEQEWKIAEYVF